MIFKGKGELDTSMRRMSSPEVIRPQFEQHIYQQFTRYISFANSSALRSHLLALFKMETDEERGAYLEKLSSLELHAVASFVTDVVKGDQSDNQG